MAHPGRTLHPWLVVLTLTLAACSGTVHSDGGDVLGADGADGAFDATGVDVVGVDTHEASAPGPFGAACTMDSECVSGICLSAGHCSRTCMSGADCPMSSNWMCVGLPGRGTVCDCTRTSMTDLPCNMIDDDCNGLVDDTSRTCSGACVDISSSPSNCGACGISCGGGTTCVAGACSCPTDHPTICGTRCVATQTDPENCGSCGHACPTGANGTAACVAGVCSLTCSAGFGDCDGNTANGCEATVRSDLANCGMCGHMCAFANASATCSTGTCILGSCNTGFTNCDGDPSNGCEANTSTSVANCGACGRACAPTNAVGACSGGTCSLAACNTGFANCDLSDATGCEASIQSDTRNCGSCGHICPGSGAPNTVTSCAAGTCAIACTAGFGDCDGNTTNGCETSTLMDPSNCGTCGHACGAGLVCSGGTCGPPCGGTPGLTLCGASCVNLATDPSNCGACGTPCASPRTCSAAVCACASGLSYCSGVCTNVSSDRLNCGACGTACPATQICAGSVCTCPAGQTLCGTTCVDLTNNTANCGTCGHACPAGQSCATSMCRSQVDIIILIDITGSNATGVTNTHSVLPTRLVAPLLALPGVAIGVGYTGEFPITTPVAYGGVGDHPLTGVTEPTTVATTVNTAIMNSVAMGGGDASDAMVEGMAPLVGLPLTTYSVGLTCSAGRVAGGCWRAGARRFIIHVTDDIFHNGPDPNAAISTPYDPYSGITPAPVYWQPDVRTACTSTGTMVFFMSSNSLGLTSPGAPQYRRMLTDIGQPTTDAFDASTSTAMGTASDALVARIRAITGL